MSSAPKRCNAPKQRKKRGNVHIHFGISCIFTHFYCFSHIFDWKFPHLFKNVTFRPNKKHFGKEKRLRTQRARVFFLFFSQKFEKSCSHWKTKKKKKKTKKKGAEKRTSILEFDEIWRLSTHLWPDFPTSIFAKKKKTLRARKKIKNNKKNASARKQI